VVRWRARALGDQVALEGAGGTRTWAALDARADRLARAMAAQGVGRGDAVAVMLPNGALWVEVALAVGRLGGRFVPVGTQSKGAELAYILADSGARLLVVAERLLAQLGEGWRGAGLAVWVDGADGAGGAEDADDARVEARVAAAAEGAFIRPLAARWGLSAQSADDDQVIMYTSGTTGRPKGATRRVNDVGVAQVLNMIAAFDLSFREVLYVCTPLYHAAPWAMSALVLGLGGRLVLADGWGGEDSLRQMEAHGVTAWLVVPTLVRRWLDLPGAVRPRALQKVYATGAKFPAAWKMEASARFGEVFFDFYGATEAGVVAVASPRDCVTHPESVGRLLPHIDARLVPVEGDDGEAQMSRDGARQGALYVRGQNFLGYTGASAQAASAGAGGAAALAGFLAIGDVAALADGYLSILGRTTDLVISGGVNIYPAEVEAALRAHPDVVDVAVVGVPDPHFGEALAAFVVARRADLTQRALEAHCDGLLSRFKRPKHVTFTDALPISPQGKVLKRALRAQWEAQQGAAPQASG
jgi:acyl-CoA synthetase (AMP-forming)/AMP-acid ligase II